jgi:glycosyl transferase/beta-hydroxylase protein BlmF
VFGEAKSVSKSWNDLYAKSVGDILIMGNDDLVYRTSLWDLRIENESERFEDEIYCMWMDDMINDDRHCAFPIVSRKWCETLGYFTPGVFEFGYNDTWVYDIAKRIGRCKWIGNVVAEHMHFSQSKSQTDDTYRRNRVGDRGNLYQLDGQTFDSLEMVEKRMADAEKLRAVMK